MKEHELAKVFRPLTRPSIEAWELFSTLDDAQRHAMASMLASFAAMLVVHHSHLWSPPSAIERTRQQEQEKKEDTRVVGFPDTTHGDLTQPSTRRSAATAPLTREDCYQCDGDGYDSLPNYGNCPRCGGSGKER